jgi:hypothetical protein
MFRWLHRIGSVDRPRLGLLFAACCELLPPSAAEGPGAGAAHRTDAGYGQIALTDAESHLSGAVWEAMRSVGSGRGEQAALATLFREIFGNPFRLVAVDPRWLTSTVLALARGIFADRAFDRMPILADALQDAGCESDDILGHCRGPGPHTRGCWVVDLVLGKE